jgi:hypothetical protein
LYFKLYITEVRQSKMGEIKESTTQSTGFLFKTFSSL